MARNGEIFRAHAHGAERRASRAGAASGHHLAAAEKSVTLLKNKPGLLPLRLPSGFSVIRG